jgi:hypothetical protein
VAYIGDYDSHGVLIDVAIERELRAHLDQGIKMHFKRLAITKEQIRQYRLPTKPGKDDRVKRTVEAEAMPVEILRKILRDWIEALLQPGAMARATVAEKQAQALLEALAMQLEKPRKR